MRLYIDRQNLINIYKEKDHRLRNEAIKTMKRQIDVYYNFSKKEAFEDEALSLLLPEFNSGLDEGINHSFEPEGYTPYELKTNIHTTHPDKHGVFLLESDKVKLCQAKKGMMIYGLGEEFDLFNTLFLEKNDYDFHRLLGIGTELSKWTDLAPYAQPFTDFVLIDNFIYDDQSLVESNLLEMLRVMHQKKSVSTNIILFTKRTKFNGKPEDFKKRIREAVKEVTQINPSVTLVLWSDQRGESSFAEHDRTAFTNYLRIYTGDSFNFFNSVGTKITKGRDVQLASLAKRENFVFTRRLIEDLNSYIKDHPHNIYGDKVSNFLTF